jgi:hypothetical protein
MHKSQSYRANAAKCLLAAEEASDPNSRRLYISRALSWLSRASEDAAANPLDAGAGTTKPVEGARSQSTAEIPANRSQAMH